MRVMFDANVLLDCLVLEASGLPRAGKAASELILTLCDTGVHQGLVAWHTLPIVAYYHERQNSAADTAAMMDALLVVLEVPTVGHPDAANCTATRLRTLKMPCKWRAHSVGRPMCSSRATRLILSAAHYRS